MSKGSITFLVRRPPQDVFDYLADLEHVPHWVPDVVEVTKISDGPVGVGTRYSEVIQMGQRQGTGELTITEYEPPRVFSHDGVGGPSRFTARFTCVPEGDGTLVTHDYSVHMTGLFWLITPLIDRWVRRNSTKAIENLKTVLEGRAQVERAV